MKVVANQPVVDFAHQLAKSFRPIDHFPVAGCSRIKSESVQWTNDGFSLRPSSYCGTLKGVAAVDREHRTRSTGPFLIKSGADTRESTHAMQVRAIFRQIFPVRVKLGVHVGN